MGPFSRSMTQPLITVLGTIAEFHGSSASAEFRKPKHVTQTRPNSFDFPPSYLSFSHTVNYTSLINPKLCFLLYHILC